jgi:hypothetical protein
MNPLRLQRVIRSADQVASPATMPTGGRAVLGKSLDAERRPQPKAIRNSRRFSFSRRYTSVGARVEALTWCNHVYIYSS